MKHAHTTDWFFTIFVSQEYDMMQQRSLARIEPGMLRLYGMYWSPWCTSKGFYKIPEL